MALLVLLLLFQGKAFKFNAFFSTATAKLEREHLAEEEWGYSILQVEVEGGKMGIQSALLVSFLLLDGAVNCKSPLMRLLQFTLWSLSSSLTFPF